MKLVTVLFVLLFSSYLVAQSTPTEATPETPAAASASESQAPATAEEITAEVQAESYTPTQDLSLQEGILTNLGLTYFGRTLEEQGAKIGELNSLNAEFRAGYIFSFGLFAGLTGHYDTGKVAGETVDRFMVGPTVGYSCSYTGILASATYYVFGQQDTKTTGKYDKVMGLQLDLAYPMEITSQLKFGPQLTYRSLEASDNDILTDNKTKELVPFMGLWFIF